MCGRHTNVATRKRCFNKGVHKNALQDEGAPQGLRRRAPSIHVLWTLRRAAKKDRLHRVPVSRKCPKDKCQRVLRRPSHKNVWEECLRIAAYKVGVLPECLGEVFFEGAQQESLQGGTPTSVSKDGFKQVTSVPPRVSPSSLLQDCPARRSQKSVFSQRMSDIRLRRVSWKSASAVPHEKASVPKECIASPQRSILFSVTTDWKLGSSMHFPPMVRTRRGGSHSAFPNKNKEEAAPIGATRLKIQDWRRFRRTTGAVTATRTHATATTAATKGKGPVGSRYEDSEGTRQPLVTTEAGAVESAESSVGWIALGMGSALRQTGYLQAAVLWAWSKRKKSNTGMVWSHCEQIVDHRELEPTHFFWVSMKFQSQFSHIAPFFPKQHSSDVVLRPSNGILIVSFLLVMWNVAAENLLPRLGSMAGTKVWSCLMALSIAFGAGAVDDLDHCFPGVRDSRCSHRFADTCDCWVGVARPDWPSVHTKTKFDMAVILLVPVVTVAHFVKFAHCFVHFAIEVILRLSCCGRPAPMPTVCWHEDPNLQKQTGIFEKG